MYNCMILKFKDIISKYGNLVPVEGKFDIPFDIKRIFYIYNVDSNLTRGHHAHRKIQQVLICVHGSVKVKCKTPTEECVYELTDPSEGLYIGPMVWGEQFDYSNDAVLLVLTSDYFDESEYIRNYDIYVEEAAQRFK